VALCGWGVWWDGWGPMAGPAVGWRRDDPRSLAAPVPEAFQAFWAGVHPLSVAPEPQGWPGVPVAWSPVCREKRRRVALARLA